MSGLTAAQRAGLQRGLKDRLGDAALPLALVIAEVVAEVLAEQAPAPAPVRMPAGDGSSLADEVWLDTAQAVAYTKRSAVTLYRHAAAGTLQSTSGGHGRRRLYRREWLDAWIEKAPRLPKKRK